MVTGWASGGRERINLGFSAPGRYMGSSKRKDALWRSWSLTHMLQRSGDNLFEKLPDSLVRGRMEDRKTKFCSNSCKDSDAERV